MSSSEKNLSDIKVSRLVNCANARYGIVVSKWNEQITEVLKEGAMSTLFRAGVPNENIVQIEVPGSFELSLGAQWMAKREWIDAVICLGCVIQGETKHFDFICNAVVQGIKDVSLKFNKPVIFGVLTTDTLVQAQDRAGGKHGNKGDEAASTALQMIAEQTQLDVVSFTCGISP